MRLILFISLSLLITTFSCSKDDDASLEAENKENIIGIWKNDRLSYHYIEFTDNGQVLYLSASSSTDPVIFYDSSYVGINYSINGNTLYWKTDWGITAAYDIQFSENGSLKLVFKRYVGDTSEEESSNDITLKPITNYKWSEQ